LKKEYANKYTKEIYDFCMEHLKYDKKNGSLVVKKSWHPSVPIGYVLGSQNAAGYISCSINNVQYVVHKLMWMMVHGHDSIKGVITHLNGIKNDNKLSNLADVEKGKYAQNCKILSPNNKTGRTGVHRAAYGRYQAFLSVNNTRVYLGSFSTPEAASAAYEEAKLQANELYMEKVGVVK
jgi:hypothetical protein